MANAWLAHVKKTMKTMKKNHTYKKGMGLKQVILAAKKTYKKHHGGEKKKEEEEVPEIPSSLNANVVTDDGAASGVEVAAVGMSPDKPGADPKGGRRRRSTKRTRRHRRR